MENTTVGIEEYVIPKPPKEAPPVGKNYVVVNGVWVLVDNPVFNVKAPVTPD